MKKTTNIVGLIAIICIVLLGVIVTLFLTVWAKPTSDDFKAANKAALSTKVSREKVDKEYTSYLDAVSDAAKNGAFASETSLKKQTGAQQTAFDNAVAAHLSNVRAVGALKATSDEEFNSAYESFKEKEVKDMAFVKEYARGYTLYIRASSFSCADVLGSSQGINSTDRAVAVKQYATENRKRSKDCLEDLQKLTESTNKPLSLFAQGYIDFIESRQTELDKAIDSGITPKKAAENAQVGIKPYTDATNEFVESRKKQFKEINNYDKAEKFYSIAKSKAAGV